MFSMILIPESAVSEPRREKPSPNGHESQVFQYIRTWLGRIWLTGRRGVRP